MGENRWRSGRRVAAAGCAAAALFTTALSGPAAAAVGDLDPSFGSGGFAFASSPGTYSGARAVAVDSKGRIVAAGFAHPDGTIAQSVMVARFEVNGQPDNGFGTGGVVLTDLPDRFDEATAVVVTREGKIVVAGRSGDDALVVRYHTDGSVDRSFRGGPVLLDLGGEEAAFSVAVTESGKVVIAGRALGRPAGVCCTLDALVARYRSNGALDPDFGGGDDVATSDLVPGSAEGGSDRFHSVVLAPGGGLVAAGTNGGDLAVARLLWNGSPDRSFGRGGVVTADVNGWLDEAAAVEPLPNGRVLVAGTACREPGPSDEDCDIGLWRFRHDGSPDKGFGNTGRVVADLGAAFGEKSVGMVRQRDGRIVVAAQTYAAGGLDLALARFRPDGARDRSFGRGGLVTTDVAGATDETTGVVLQPDGRIVVAGIAGLNTTFSFVAARFTA